MFKSRNQAKMACVEGRVKKNGREVKPKEEVNVGDIFEIQFMMFRIKIRVKDIPVKQLKKSEYENYYELLEREKIKEWREESFWDELDRL